MKIGAQEEQGCVVWPRGKQESGDDEDDARLWQFGINEEKVRVS